jgi:hypothetical protein
MNSNKNENGGNCALLEAKDQAEFLSREIDTYVFIMMKDNDFEVTINCEDVVHENLLLLYYAGEEVLY